jgi:hypothetical protein
MRSGGEKATYDSWFIVQEDGKSTLSIKVEATLIEDN